jgi:hypothetical protein
VKNGLYWTNINENCLVVSVLATEPTGYSVAGSSPTEDGGFLRVIKNP